MAKTQIYRLSGHRLFFSKICLTMVLLLLLLVGVASGSGNIANKLEKNAEIPNVIKLMKIKNTANQDSNASTAPVIQLVDDVYENQSNMKDEIPLKELKIVKRAPNGFTGMRGKKLSEQNISDESDNISNNDNTNNMFAWNNHNLYKYLNDLNTNENNRYKKAPTAFYGVRGKKYTNGIFDYKINGLNNIIEEIERERLRESAIQNFIDQLADKVASQNEIAKRAPTGFTGMRGKRPSENFYDNDYMDNSQMSDDMDMEKRGPNKAFVGVRGKKDLTAYESRQHQSYKRSPREVYNNPNAVGAKRQRFVDFGNKFVAVRGKKDSITDNINDDNVGEEAANDFNDAPLKSSRNRAQIRYFVNMLPSLFFGSSGDVGGKRTPAGFMGLRGKR